MIGYENTMGTVEISQEYFANLIGMAAAEWEAVMDRRAKAMDEMTRRDDDV